MTVEIVASISKLPRGRREVKTTSVTSRYDNLDRPATPWFADYIQEIGTNIYILGRPILFGHGERRVLGITHITKESVTTVVPEGMRAKIVKVDEEVDDGESILEVRTVMQRAQRNS